MQRWLRVQCWRCWHLLVSCVSTVSIAILLFLSDSYKNYICVFVTIALCSYCVQYTSTLKNCRDELVKKVWWKKYISLHVVYNLYWTLLNQSECIRNAKLKHSYPNGQFLQTPHVGICMQVWLHGTYGGHSWTYSHPYLVPILFSPVHPYISFNFFKIF